eukprot:CAMPEP_0201697536 /NCGR_PEP_ID=MMETSP0578-20130828/11369_1 /ASSEMBLY_ACC=CAM_ASM_000663 /TAXON_ID=267565 /ORGANISM="Skeletonema grethea, Strain CCMP 1804" /LENGTH=126 /DNA_ID=CAMNT_0048183725 /DNA_START=53 /DNA_END=433 /DNA_ORIENTATION=+
MNAIHLLRQVAVRSPARPSFAASSCRALSSSVIPEAPQSAMDGSDKSLNRLTRTESMYKLGKHRSNGLELIEKVPPIEVEGDMAVCDGGGGALGHPLEYIKVGYRGGEPVSCVYCGLKYVQKAGGH